MSESKYRKALESIAANTCCGSCQEAALVAREALAQPAEAVELTDEELNNLGRGYSLMHFDKPDGKLKFARAVIAAHEAKKNGGGV